VEMCFFFPGEDTRTYGFSFFPYFFPLRRGLTRCLPGFVETTRSLCGHPWGRRFPPFFGGARFLDFSTRQAFFFDLPRSNPFPPSSEDPVSSEDIGTGSLFSSRGFPCTLFLCRSAAGRGFFPLRSIMRTSPIFFFSPFTQRGEDTGPLVGFAKGVRFFSFFPGARILFLPFLPFFPPLELEFLSGLMISGVLLYQLSMQMTLQSSFSR